MLKPKPSHLIIILMLPFFGCSRPETNKPFIPFTYVHSIEKLKAEFSPEILKKAHTELAELEKTNLIGTYHGTFESIDLHPTPEWYKDAKLCIFYDWGPYSIAGYGRKGWSRARYPDWYLNHMYHGLSDYHKSNWGEDFQRDDFLPLFMAANFNADEIVEMVKMSGARYLVPFSKHHDGFCLWNSEYTHRDVSDMFPGRDLSAELTEACKKAGIYHGFYFSVEEY